MTANGEQFEIRLGAAQATVNEVGASLRAFEVHGLPYVETYPADTRPPMGCGAVLVPWPNRVGSGRWEWDGQLQQLALTDPERLNAIHGLAQHLSWQPVDRTESSVTLGVRIDVQPGWPVGLETTVRYEVVADGLVATHTVTNVGDSAVPFGLGVHPYLRAGNAATDECTLRLAATTVQAVEADRQVPTGDPKRVDGSEHDFRAGRKLVDVDLDLPFGGCAPAPDDPDHLVRHKLTAPDGGAVELWADPVFRWVHVFTPDRYPGRGRAVAVEPMTCPPNALQTGIDLIVLGPAETWSARWGMHALV
ncbi:MAG: aldose 1-epimerase family protein [Acidimicrobiales bacterium]